MYFELKKNGFQVKIPTCTQNERQKEASKTDIESMDERDDTHIEEEHSKKSKKMEPLTTKQTGDSRLSTKVYFLYDYNISIYSCTIF